MSTPNLPSPLQLVGLDALMARTPGNPDVTIGLLDGPVDMTHPILAGARVRPAAEPGRACARVDSVACQHGTFIAGVLAGRRTADFSGLCPECTLFVRPLFGERTRPGEIPSVTPPQLARGIADSVEAGARVLNLSLTVTHRSDGEQVLERALDSAMRRGAIVVCAAGNQRQVGSTLITRHPWVIPVAGCDGLRRPLRESNLGGTIGRHGLTAPGDGVTGPAAGGGWTSFRGTSVAVPFVTGTVALLWSMFPDATAAQVKYAVTHAVAARRGSVVPPLLDAEGAYRWLANRIDRRRTA